MNSSIAILNAISMIAENDPRNYPDYTLFWDLGDMAADVDAIIRVAQFENLKALAVAIELSAPSGFSLNVRSGRQVETLVSIVRGPFMHMEEKDANLKHLVERAGGDLNSVFGPDGQDLFSKPLTTCQWDNEIMIEMCATRNFLLGYETDWRSGGEVAFFGAQQKVMMQKRIQYAQQEIF